MKRLQQKLASGEALTDEEHAFLDEAIKQQNERDEQWSVTMQEHAAQIEADEQADKEAGVEFYQPPLRMLEWVKLQAKVFQEGAWSSEGYAAMLADHIAELAKEIEVLDAKTPQELVEHRAAMKEQR